MLQVSGYTWEELAPLRWPGSDEGVVQLRPLLERLVPKLKTIILDLKPTLQVGGACVGEG